MKVVLQRVKQASVTIEQKTRAEIGNGLLLLLGIEAIDDKQDIDWLCKKIINLRVFSDADGKMNHSVKDIEGEVIVVSQFTLHASVKKGTRPSFTKAAPPAIAVPLYEQFVQTMSIMLPNKVQTGIFGADMQVQLINDGPVTIILDSQNKL